MTNRRYRKPVYDPWRRLASAMLTQSLIEISRGAAGPRRWLIGGFGRDLIDSLELDISAVVRFISKWPVLCDEFKPGKAPNSFASGTFGAAQTSVNAVLAFNHAEQVEKKSATNRRKPGANQKLLLATVARYGYFDIREIAGDDFARRRGLQVCAKKMAKRGLLSYQSSPGRHGFTVVGPPG